MPNKHNQSEVTELTESVKKAKSIAVIDYAGTTVNDQVKLRSALRKVGGELRVAKNTLINIAIGKPELKESLNGMSAIVLSFTDEVAAIKALFAFKKESEKLVIKQGVMDDKVLSIKELEALSKLPGKQELISMLISRLNGPAYGMVNVLKASQRGLVYALKAIADQKGSQSPSSN
ncbi:50S ribosomal protein L10 [Candidatus Woesebacteria bacterium]|nr:50S ribosomal protein L10 [Candidatus Woesebacteria bacterium]